MAPASIKLQALQGKAFTVGLGICMLLGVQSVAVLPVIHGIVSAGGAYRHGYWSRC